MSDRTMTPYEKGKQKERFPTDVSMTSFLRYYRDRYVKGNNTSQNPYNISRKLYGQIIREFNKRVMDRILYEAQDFKIPCRLGYIGIRKYKNKLKVDENGKVLNRFPVNWKATWDLWKEDPEARKKGKKVHLYNEHSDEYTAYFKYSKSTAIFPNKSLYKLRMARKNTRELSNIMRDPVKYGNVNYFEPDRVKHHRRSKKKAS